MKRKLEELYGADFYEQHIEGMYNSAITVLGLLYDYYQPQAVIDLGCGQGAWLAAAETLGANKLLGMDGEWVSKDALLSKNINFIAVNFDEYLPELKEKYDLCISLEVAEHISEGNSRKFIDLLCTASDIVLFGAAVKCQGGTNHINEQWQSYWIELFKENGFECLDIIRPTLWNNMSVEWWYRQNTFLFIKPGNRFLQIEKLRSLEKPIRNIVHPTNYENKVNSYRNNIRNPTFQFSLRCIKRYIRNKIM